MTDISGRAQTVGHDGGESSIYDLGYRGYEGPASAGGRRNRRPHHAQPPDRGGLGRARVPRSSGGPRVRLLPRSSRSASRRSSRRSGRRGGVRGALAGPLLEPLPDHRGRSLLFCASQTP